MTEISIDLASLQDEYVCGSEGDHGNVRLLLDISCIASDDISYYVCKFESSMGDVVKSRRFLADELIDNVLPIVLWQSITEQRISSLVIQCICRQSGGVSVIRNSPVVSLRFNELPSDDDGQMLVQYDSALYELEAIRRDCISAAENVANDVKSKFSIKENWVIKKEYVVTDEINSFIIDGFRLTGEFAVYLHTQPNLSNPNSNGVSIQLNGEEEIYRTTGVVDNDEDCDNTACLFGTVKPYHRAIFALNSSIKDSSVYMDYSDDITSIKFTLYTPSYHFGIGTVVTVYEKEVTLEVE